MTIPPQAYVKFTSSPGKMPDIVIEMWQNIWKMNETSLGAKRAYIADFEIYDERSHNPKHSVLDIYLGIKDLVIKKSNIGQFEDGLGVFANRDFEKGEVVIKWNLKELTQTEYEKLNEYEQDNFCHKRHGVIYYYPDPERHVNRSKNPNVFPSFEKKANIALRNIQKGEELSILDTIKEDF